MKRGTSYFLCILLLFLGIFNQRISALDMSTEIIGKAQQYIGSSYCRGGAAPPCFDCSGFVRYILRPYISSLPRTSRQMAQFGTPVGRDGLRPGDLVFFATTSSRGTISHVALYIGQNSIIHAISDGPDRGVHVTSLDSRYWRTRFHSAARVLSLDFGDRTSQTIAYAKGRYSGELNSGEPHGSGILILNNGDRYSGEFKMGAFHGEGTYTYANGAEYVGEFTEGKMNGHGVFKSADGKRTEGSWIQGVLAEGAGAEKEEITTYMDRKDSPWDSWEGYIRGDFEAWQQQEQESFEKWKKENSPDF